MRKRLWILTAAALTAAVMGAAGAAAAAEYDRGTDFDALMRERGYVLASAEGSVGVYRDGKLLFTAPVDPATLRRVDREALEAGIGPVSYEEVLMLIEDLSN